jgi:hypothetical protein
MKCEKCGAIIDDPVQTKWLCSICNDDLLTQGTLFVEERCNGSLQDRDTCDECKAGIMVLIEIRGRLIDTPTGVEWNRLNRVGIKCITCGHVHIINPLKDFGVGTESINIDKHPSTVNREKRE